MRRSIFPLLCVAIICLAFFLRIFRISSFKEFYFDEVYHGFTATTFLHNDPKGYEYWQTPPAGVAYEWTHPPLAKLLMAGGMIVFGENSFGWRITSVLFGTGVIAMVGVLAHTLFAHKKITLLALLLASLDGLLLAMSRIAMNDMHFLFFGLVAVYFYIQSRKNILGRKKLRETILSVSLSALFLGLALASKWTALYLGAALGLDLILALCVQGKFPVKAILASGCVAIAIVPVVYLASYTQFFLQGHTPKQWKETTQQMWWYHTGLKATHPFQSRPIQWITDTRPVWMAVDYSKNDQGIVANIYNAGNPFLFWTGLVTISLLSIQMILVGAAHFSNFLLEEKKTVKGKLSWEVWFPVFLYFSLWLPWQFSPRIMFFYHYAPALPFLCLSTAYGLVTAQERYPQTKYILFGLLVAIAVVFFLLYPLNTGYPMPQAYFDKVFAVFPSWK